MAVIVPIILAYTGATAAAGVAIGAAIGVSAAAGAAIFTVGTAVAMQYSGANDKINKAATKVFGEDLVKVGNVAGGIALGAGVFGGAAGAGASASSLDTANAVGAAGGDGLGSLIGSEGARWGVSTADLAAAGGGYGYGDVGPPAPGTGADVGPTFEAATRMNPGSAPTTTVTNGGTITTATVAPRAPTVAAPASPSTANDTVFGTLGQKWDGMSDSMKGTLLNMGGNALKGMADGAAKDKEAQAVVDERIRQEDRFRTGSGTSWVYRPRAGTAPGT